MVKRKVVNGSLALILFSQISLTGNVKSATIASTNPDKRTLYNTPVGIKYLRNSFKKQEENFY